MITGKNKILIVEDEKIIALDIRKTLEKLGYEITGIVNNGIDAVESAKRDTPDLVLMDIMLNGELNGIETAEILSKSCDIPLVYLTALTDIETLDKAKITEPYGYLPKPFDQKGLHTTIEMALYKHKAESELKARTRELEDEKRKTDILLHNILPAEIVEEFKANGVITPRLFEQITILFTHFHDFTNASLNLDASVLVGELNEIFHAFDAIVEGYGLEKLKTIGDIYMVGGGLPKVSNDHAEKIIEAALEMNSYMKERNRKSKYLWELKSGVNTGQVVAGIVGTHKFTYDVWGDTVNIASRLENSSEPGKINISGSTYGMIKDRFECEYRGKLSAKGKGLIDMYFVKQKKIYN